MPVPGTKVNSAQKYVKAKESFNALLHSEKKESNVTDKISTLFDEFVLNDWSNIEDNKKLIKNLSKLPDNENRKD